jgi:hypothetical protein
MKAVPSLNSIFAAVCHVYGILESNSFISSTQVISYDIKIGDDVKRASERLLKERGILHI